MVPPISLDTRPGNENIITLQAGLVLLPVLTFAPDCYMLPARKTMV
jgi:hypothetical protein